jgi:hypothetical protein
VGHVAVGLDAQVLHRPAPEPDPTQALDVVVGGQEHLVELRAEPDADGRSMG